MSSKDTALKIVARISGVEEVELKPSMDLVGHLGFDSAKALELLVELEEELGIEFGDEDVAKMNTVGDILAFVGLQTAAGA
jgi:acyl carrier protein